jgi:UDP-N-acetylmuramate dehydrogenase
MLSIQKSKSLKPYNTFGFEAKASFFAEINESEDIKELLKTDIWAQTPHFIIGGGSNILLREDFDGLVVLNKIIGTEIISKTKSEVLVKVGGGVNWHEFVLYTISQNLGGMENLSLIPGTVGAAPMQNIGAYGVEIKDTFHSLEAVNLSSGEIEVFNNADCQFGYRESVFKKELKGRYFINSVTFKLVPAESHILDLNYGAIQEILKENGITEPTIKNVSDAVISIRQSKLPDPKLIGNSGSFFKNPVVNIKQFEELRLIYPEIPGYELNADEVKLAAGWLIEKAGWKGYKENGVGVHEKQALVLVNFGEGSGKAIEVLAKKIQDSIVQKFGVLLNPEVNFI